MSYDYAEMINQAFDIFGAKVQHARVGHIQQTKLGQAALGYIGKSSGQAHLLGKNIIQSNITLARELIGKFDSIISTGGADVPVDGAERLTESFNGALVYLGELCVTTVRDYLDGDSVMGRRVLPMIQVEWSTARNELDQEFGLMVRKHRTLPRTKPTGEKTEAPIRRERTQGINGQVRPVHFEDYSGKDFERLVFAFALRQEWTRVEWLGEAGTDGGRDIWCENNDGSTAVFLCANFKRLTFRKARSDLQKVGSNGTKPAQAIVVAGGSVSAVLRKKIKAEADKIGTKNCEIWSGAEFEEHVRLNASDLLERFCHAEEFPETPEKLRAFADANRGLF